MRINAPSRVAWALLLALVCAPQSVWADEPMGPVTVITIIDVVPDYAKPQNVEASASLLSKLAADAAGMQGVVSFKVLRDRSRANHFVIESVWQTMQAFDAYSGSDVARSFRQAFQPRQGGPFDERVYVDLK